MSTITITVPGEEFENLSIELSAEEVTALYKLRKDQTAKVAELEKKLTDLERNKKYSEDKLTIAHEEISHANVLLTALGIQEKTAEEEAYYRKPLPVATRIALYIATSRMT
jgi:hypothetical protein